MEARGAAAEFLPARLSLASLQRAASRCTACPLHEGATQTVFGDGLVRAEVMAIGEQPGDREDLAGEPFVGPAGRILDDGFQQAGIDRKRVYTTNAVKHFKWEQRGKRRIHQKPNRHEIEACHPWLEAEVEVIEPDVVLLLGATAAKVVLGSSFSVTKHRGEVLESRFSPRTVATFHPSSVLRAGDDRHDAMDAFVADLRVVAGMLDRSA